MSVPTLNDVTTLCTLTTITYDLAHDSSKNGLIINIVRAYSNNVNNKGISMTTQQQDIESLLVEVKQLREELTTITSKGGLVEKITFAGIPILFSCIVYLMMALNGLQRDNTILQSKIAIVVNADNKAIPPQGTTIDMAQIREQLGDRIDKLERDESLARAGMTLEREKQLAQQAQVRAESNQEMAVARSQIKSDLEHQIQKLHEDLGDKIDAGDKESLKNAIELEKRLSLLEYKIEQMEKSKK
jgi:hypothetical protein